jgi:hypothetical protein
MDFLFIFSFGFLASSLQIHLESYDLDQIFISLCFSLESAFYLILCLTSAYIFKRFDERYIMIMGSMILGISYLLLGPWTVVFPDRLPFVLISLPLFGIGQCFTYSKI